MLRFENSFLTKDDACAKIARTDFARQMKRRAFSGLLPFFLAALTLYFTYFTLQGGRGLVALSQLKAQHQSFVTQQGRLDARQNWLETRISALRAHQFDADYLEERGRVVLHYTYPDDIVVLGL